MPTSTKPVNISPYEIANELPLPKNKPLLINQKRRSAVSLRELPPSPANSDLDASTMPPTSALSKDESRLFRPLERGAPGDQAIFSDSKTPEQKDLAKRKSQFYTEAFAQREPNSSARERISRESMVVADVRTNVIIQDEFTFITDLSYFLSTRYQRPEGSVIVTLNHSACLLFSGSFDPAYTIAISGLSSQLQPVTNKRNCVLIQKHMEESLGPGPERGLVTFIPIAEENLATNNKTVAGQVDELEKELAGDNTNMRRSISKAKKRQSTKSLRNMKTNSSLMTHPERIVTTTSDGDAPPMPAMPTEKSDLDRKAEKVQKVSRRKSFMASVFGRGG